MKKIALIHFQPIEMFPPCVNFIRNLPSKHETHLFSCKNHKARQELKFEHVQSYRYDSPADLSVIKLVSLSRHLLFTLRVFFRLLKLKPDTIVYYETFSAFPVFLYSLISSSKAKIYIHCHEYYSKHWFKKQSVILQFYHFLEKISLYKTAIWISQTNEKRKELFGNNYPFIGSDVLKVMPNHPPRSWQSKKTHPADEKIRFVYIGTLSINYTYIKEFCEWVKNKQNYEFDIYSYNLDNDALNYLSSLDAANINFFHQGIDYDDIPKVLNQYSVGLILYKALTDNFKYNETNKLFEYLSCDLDVWFAKEILGCYKHTTNGTWPEVKKVDFAELDASEDIVPSKKNVPYKPIKFDCESAFSEILDSIRQ